MPKSAQREVTLSREIGNRAREPMIAFMSRKFPSVTLGKKKGISAYKLLSSTARRRSSKLPYA